MILGYEQPVDIPVMSMYDKDMMKMYLGALREDYQQGLEDQKEFNKMASEFYSPIAKDNDTWYNLTTKPIVEYLNQNPDAIRSVEGRAAIRQFINSRPYQDMAKLRQSADMAKTYNDLKAKLKAAGKYSDDLERTLGVGDLATWDTLKNGVWNTESPTEMKDLYSLTHDRFDPLAKMDFDLGPGRDKYHRRKGVEERHMTPIVDQAIDGIRNTPYYKLFLERYGNDEGIKKAIIDVNRGVLHDSEITDEVELAKLKEAGENTRARLARSSGNNNTSGSPYSVTKQIQDDSFGGMGYTTAEQYLQDIVGRATKKISDREKKYGKPLTDAQKNNIIAEEEYIAQKDAISTRIKAGDSIREAIRKTGTSTAPVKDLTRAVFGESAFDTTNGDVDANMYIKLTPRQKQNLYTMNGIYQLCAKKKNRKAKAIKVPSSYTKDMKVKVETMDNVYRVFDVEQNRHRTFVIVTDEKNGYNYAIEATETLNPRSAVAQSVDAMQNKAVGQGSKALENVQGNNR